MPKAKKSSVHLNPAILDAVRTIHIYLTLLGFMVMLGFGINGFTANHEDWFGATEPLVTESESRTPVELIQKGDALRIVEHLRQQLRITGALGGYDNLDDRISLGFKSPKDSWEIDIEKASGKTMVHHEAFNSIAVLNNLHRGRNAGPRWSWIIDLSAFLIVLACLTGAILWLSLPQRRRVGILWMLLGAGVTLAVFYWLVPGGDVKPESKSVASAPAAAPGERVPTTVPASSPHK
jgi:hypothetical protein